MQAFAIPVAASPLSDFAPVSRSCSIYQNPAILQAATAAFWTSCRVVSKFLWIVPWLVVVIMYTLYDTSLYLENIVVKLCGCVQQLDHVS